MIHSEQPESWGRPQKLQGRTEEGSTHVPWGASGTAARRSCLLSCVLRRWAARAGQLPWLPSEFCINQTFDPRGCSQKVGRLPESGLGDSILQGPGLC